MAKILIRGGAVLTMDPGLGEIPGGDVRIEGDRIAAVGRGLPAEDAEVVDASCMIVLPGFVDAHLHTWQTGLRGIAGDWSLGDYMRHMHAGLATRFTPEDLYLANYVGAWNQMNAGVTSLFDWCHNNPTPEHTDAAVEALFAAGVRAVFGHGTPKPDVEEGGIPHTERPHPPGEVKRLRTGHLADDEALVTLALAVRGPDISSYEAASRDIRLAREYSLVASCHLGGRFARMTPDGVHRLRDDGLLGPWFNAVHANKLSDEELRLLVDAGATVTSCPEVEAQMGHGLPVTGRLLAVGGAPSLGVDIESNVGGDMFAPMRFALQLQRALDNHAAHLRGEEVAEVSIPARRALEWGTIEGARAMGMAHRIGSLARGKQADVILLRSDDLNLFPAHEPAEAVLFHANPSNVDTVIVAGAFRKRGGRLLCTDLEGKMARLAESGRRLVARG